MVGAYAMFGYYFGRNPTSSTRLGEENINIARNTAPWSAGGGEVENSDRNNYKYMYHPGGDYRNAPKRAPSALNAVIVPGVTLPKVCLCVMCSGGGEGRADKLVRRNCMRGLISMERITISAEST